MMKKIEAAFSRLSFTIAAIAAAMLYLRMPEAAFFSSVLGTMMIMMAYVVVKRIVGEPELD